MMLIYTAVEYDRKMSKGMLRYDPELRKREPELYEHTKQSIIRAKSIMRKIEAMFAKMGISVNYDGGRMQAEIMDDNLREMFLKHQGARSASGADNAEDF